MASFEVHAEPPGDLERRLNGVLPAEIAVLEAVRRPQASTLAAMPAHGPTAIGCSLPPSRTRSSSAGHFGGRGSSTAACLERCAETLVGEHDFTAFTPTQTDHVRFDAGVIAAEWRAHRLSDPFSGQLFELWIEADSFMRHMVRVLVGTMLEVTGGQRTMDDFERLLGALHASKPARRLPRTASTWRRSATERSPRRCAGCRLGVLATAQLDLAEAGRTARAGTSKSPVASSTALPSALVTSRA